MTSFYYYYEDALAAAENFANENNGHIASREVALDDRHDFYYEDDKARNLCWSGETNAIVVRDNDTYEDIEYFAYWCSKADDEE